MQAASTPSCTLPPLPRPCPPPLHRYNVYLESDAYASNLKQKLASQWGASKGAREGPTVAVALCHGGRATAQPPTQLARPTHHPQPLQACGSVLVAPVPLEYHEWWSRALQPGVHYVEATTQEDEICDRVRWMCGG